MNNLSLYIHYPFCKSKCPYCDFNSYCNIKIDENDLIRGYLNELDYYKNIIKNKNINTIFFGGGTPSLMSANFLSQIINKINELGNIDKNCEISLEANPNSITFEKINDFHKIGINRFSIGVQSLYDKELKDLGRIHNREDIFKAIDIARKVFNDRYSIDLIYTRPNQNINDWKIELEEAIKLSPFHISLYQLIIEKGTPFYKRRVRLPEDDLSIEFYNVTREILEKNGINFYEISNYAKKGYECKHNLVYWQNGNWLGIGAGAHSRVDINSKRYAIQNVKDPNKWLEKCLKNNNGVSKKNCLLNQEIIEEFVLMGLRIKDGIEIKNLQKNIKCNSFYDILSKNGLDILQNNNLIEVNKEQIKIKNEGFLLLNSIIEKILVN